MAFFSNPKRKEYILNPRRKALYEDTSRFGTKMLEKMGWTKGKGLGANLEGNLDFIKVSHKSDQKGVGFQDRDDQWTQHEAQFNSLLRSFDKSDGSSDSDLKDEETSTQQGFGFSSAKKQKKVKEVFSGCSLEEQSKQSRARVHYKKFTRGKDMARYSEKDLANIFGKRTLNLQSSLEKIEVSDKSADNEKSEKEEKVDNSFGITVIKTGTSIQDYFKAKMEARRNYIPVEKTPTVDVINVQESVQVKISKKKKKGKQENIDDEIVMVVNENMENVVIKKKKKKKRIDSEAILVQAADEEQLLPKEKRKRSDEDENEELPKKRKKSKKSGTKEIDELKQTELILPTGSKIKKKKKKNEEQVIQSHPFTNVISNVLVNVLYNSVKDTSDVSIAPCPELLPDNFERTTESEKEIFELAKYKAEVFRFFDFNGFQNTNLNGIPGYGFTNNIELKIINKMSDTQNINNFWDKVLSNKYAQDSTAIKKQSKKKKYSMKTLHKKNVFKGV